MKPLSPTPTNCPDTEQATREQSPRCRFRRSCFGNDIGRDRRGLKAKRIGIESERHCYRVASLVIDGNAEKTETETPVILKALLVGRVGNFRLNTSSVDEIVVRISGIVVDTESFGEIVEFDIERSVCQRKAGQVHAPTNRTLNRICARVIVG